MPVNSPDLQRLMKDVVKLSRLPVPKKEESDDYSEGQVEELLTRGKPTGSETPKHSPTASDGGLSLEVQGKICMQLRYDGGASPVDIVIDDTHLRIIRDDGTEASIPLRAAAA